MADTENWLVHDHRRYEAALADSVAAAEAEQWKLAMERYEGLVDELRLHMRMEDDVIFPLLEEETGDPDGAIAELRDEHRDLVRLLRDLNFIVKTRNVDHLLESLVPLKAAMAYHNDHEEAVLSVLARPSLLRRREEVEKRLAATRLGRWDF